MTGFGEGRVALVTVAAGPMGFATAKALAEEGLRVAIGDVAADRVEEAAATIEGSARLLSTLPTLPLARQPYARSKATWDRSRRS